MIYDLVLITYDLVLSPYDHFVFGHDQSVTPYDWFRPLCDNVQSVYDLLELNDLLVYTPSASRYMVELQVRCCVIHGRFNTFSIEYRIKKVHGHATGGRRVNHMKLSVT